MEVVETVYPPIFGLKLPVVKARHHLPAGIYGFFAGIKKLNFSLPLQ